jgi:hypothetical protein
MLRDLPILRGAQFAESGRYRYCLTRQWQHTRPRLTIIMLNPSLADGTQDDPTIRRCIGLAQGWKFGAITVVNLFAYCTAYPSQLKQVQDPIGAGNDAALQKASSEGAKILLAWGNWGGLYGRDEVVLEGLSPFHDKLCCLGRNRTGQPRHPLYVSRKSELQPWGYPQSASNSSIFSRSSRDSGSSYRNS